MLTICRSYQRPALLAGVLVFLPFLLGQGCPGTGGGGGMPWVVLDFPNLDRSVAVGEQVTVVYDATNATSVRAFYDHDGQANTGDEVVFSGSLPSGTNQVTQLATATLPTGLYYLGIAASNSAGTSVAYAAGRITLVSNATVTFLSPASNINVGPGVQVPIRVNTGLTSYSYRLFYDRDGVFNGNEVKIFEGLSDGTSFIEKQFDTSGLTSGAYYIGVTVTTSVGSSVTAYAPGKVTVVTGVYVQVLAPTVGLRAVAGDAVQVVVAANDPANPNANLRIFYDLDNTFGNGNEITIEIVSQSAGGAMWDTTGVATGDYYVGAELLNGLTPPVVSYSAGPVELASATEGSGGGDGSGNGVVILRTPASAISVLQGSVFRVSWITTVPRGGATVKVFREPDLNNDGQPDGAATRVVLAGGDGIDSTLLNLDWNTQGVVGKFFIGLTTTLASGLTLDPVYARGTVTVSPRTAWVGAFDTKYDSQGLVVPQTGFFKGAVFRGHNFRDNLGSAMLVADDYDRDGKNEIVLVAQFAKPYNFSNNGRGAGEAYLIYGQKSRYLGSYNVNTTGSNQLPGVIFSGIVPNPLPGDDPTNPTLARAGSSIPYSVDGLPAAQFATEGLRSLTLIPDQDGDGRREIVFGVPWCNSLSLWNQILLGIHPTRLAGTGRLENNGHFLRGGVVVVSSRNSLLSDRTAISRFYDRVMQLHEVGQIFSPMVRNPPNDVPLVEDLCPLGAPDGADDYVTWPCEGFFQDTSGVGYGTIDPPRLAEPELAGGLIVPNRDPDAPWSCGDLISLSQVDLPVGSTQLVGGRAHNGNETCEPNVNGGPPFGFWPFGFMRTLGTGFYGSGTICGERTMADPLEPFGCRILGRTTSQCPIPPTCDSTANRFGTSVALSGNTLLVGAPLRTVRPGEVPLLATERREAGVVYMIQLKRPGAPADGFFWSVPDVTASVDLPAPHNFIVDDLGYGRCNLAGLIRGPGTASFSMTQTLHVVGGAPGDQVGDVTALHDINNDSVPDFAVGAPNAVRIAGEPTPRGAVYVIYRRQPEIEGDYLLEDLARDLNDPQRLNGLMILGEEGENIGRSIAGAGPLNDDYNDDGYADLLIGSPNALTAGGAGSGEVFLLFGGRNILNPQGGITIAELRARGDGMLLIGANPGDAVGMTVANAGDVNGDRIPDILIAAPYASPSFAFDSNGDGTNDAFGLDLNGDGVADDLNLDGQPDNLTNAGVVYVVYGGSHLTGTISLGQIGTAYLPGFTIVGRKSGDAMGGGLTQNQLLSNGVSPAGDLDGDGLADLLVSSILADPEGKTDAGEVYLIYGFRP